jgi:probable HAF family extracellular repeat protein
MTHMTKFAGATALALTLAGNAWAAPLYAVTDIGPVPGAFSVATSINDAGQIVGTGSVRDGASTVFLYDKGNYQDLTPGSWGTMGGSINNLSHVAGNFRGTQSTPFIYRDGTLKEIDIPTGHDLTLSGINDAGQIVGSKTSQVLSQQSEGFILQNDEFRWLGSLDGRGSIATGINNKGQIVGFSEVGESPGGHAFIWENGSMTDLGTLDNKDPGTGSYGMAINDHGHVVGTAFGFNVHPHAFLYSNGAMQDLGALDAYQSVATGLNEQGEVIGVLSYFDDSANQTDEAFVYRNGEMQKLQALIDPAAGWALRQAVGINESGQIVGAGTFNGVERGFLLTPVPEPSTWAMLALGLMTLAGMRTGKRRSR